MNENQSDDNQQPPQHPAPQWPAVTPQPNQNYPYYPPPVQYVQVPVAVAPPNAGGAVAAMVLGIVSMFICCFGWITGVIAIALAATAMKKINDSGGQYGGRGMAITGLVLGIISVVCYLPWMVLWLIGVASAPVS